MGTETSDDSVGDWPGGPWPPSGPDGPDAPGRAESTAPGARSLAFALYDPNLR